MLCWISKLGKRKENNQQLNISNAPNDTYILFIYKLSEVGYTMVRLPVDDAGCLLTGGTVVYVLTSSVWAATAETTFVKHQHTQSR